MQQNRKKHKSYMGHLLKAQNNRIKLSFLYNFFELMTILKAKFLLRRPKNNSFLKIKRIEFKEPILGPILCDMSFSFSQKYT